MVDTFWETAVVEGAPITGNAAKIRVLMDLWSMFETGAAPRILDVGCVGPTPFDFWRPLLEHFDFALTGVDVQGIERAAAVAEQSGWAGRVSLHRGTGYDLSALFPAAAFDVVVATQVLEHVARIERFMGEVAKVLAPGGEAFFTVDSAHWASRFGVRRPLRLAKNVVKKVLAVAGRERHYDLPWTDDEVVRAAEQAGLQAVSVRYYNLEPLKWLHNHVVAEASKNDVARRWFELEDALNDDEAVRRDGRERFMGLYVRVRKP